MNVLACAFLILFAASANADFEDIDWSKVVPVSELPGYWDSRPALKQSILRSSSGRNARIIGGAVVAPNSIPFMIGLLMSNFDGGLSLCGGSLINVRTTLTAAHCVWNFQITARSTLVIAGAHQLQANEPTQQRRTVLPAEYRIHEQADFSRGMNDVAVLRHQAFTLNNFVGLVFLPTAFRNDMFVNEQARISGWGQTGWGQGTSTHLRSVNKIVMSNELCSRFHGSHINPTVVCTREAAPASACGKLSLELSIFVT